MQIALISYWFQPNSFGEVCFLEESYENMQKKKKSNFDNFERALYSTSGSMPLTLKHHVIKVVCDSGELILSKRLERSLCDKVSTEQFTQAWCHWY